VRRDECFLLEWGEIPLLDSGRHGKNGVLQVRKRSVKRRLTTPITTGEDFLLARVFFFCVLRAYAPRSAPKLSRREYHSDAATIINAITEMPVQGKVSSDSQPLFVACCVLLSSQHSSHCPRSRLRTARRAL